jgi:polyisoprenoid-binding protein YceI
MFLSRIPASLASLTLSGTALASTSALYAVDPAASTVRITSSDGTQPYEVSLSNVAGSLRVSGEQPSPRSLDLVFDLKALHGTDSALDQRLRGSRYLWVDRFPYAVALASDMRATGAGTFAADATIALRNTSCLAPMAFRWSLNAEGGQSVGHLHGTSRVSARDFGIRGDAAQDDWFIAYDLRLVATSGDAGSVTRHRPDSSVITEDYPPPRCVPAWAETTLSPETVRAAQRG